MNEQDPTGEQQDPNAERENSTAAEGTPLPTGEGSPADRPLPTFPPPGVEAPEGSTRNGIRPGDAGVDALEPFWFCFRVNGRSWGQQAFFSSGPDEAASTARRMAAIYQLLLRNMGYRNAVVRANAGRCS